MKYTSLHDMLIYLDMLPNSRNISCDPRDRVGAALRRNAPSDWRRTTSVHQAGSKAQGRRLCQRGAHKKSNRKDIGSGSEERNRKNNSCDSSNGSVRPRLPRWGEELFVTSAAVPPQSCCTYVSATLARRSHSSRSQGRRRLRRGV